jgi:hypothetical protein
MIAGGTRTGLLAWAVAAVLLSGTVSTALAGENVFTLGAASIGQGWGETENQPIASPIPGADRDLKPSLSERAWLVAYGDALLQVPATLNAARAADWYDVPSDLWRAHVHSFQPVPRDLPAKLDERRRAAELALLAELDQRFEMLTARVRAASYIVLPAETTMDGVAGKVNYCGWIRDEFAPITPLRRNLFARCIADRDKFLTALVVQVAKLVPVPPLPRLGDKAASGLLAGTDGLTDARARAGDIYELPTSVHPNENTAPWDYQAAVHLFQATLRARFIAALPGLTDELHAELRASAQSDVLESPEQACAKALGPYAGTLASVPGIEEAATRLQLDCQTIAAEVQQARMERLQQKLAPSSVVSATNAAPTVAPDDTAGLQGPNALCAQSLRTAIPGIQYNEFNGAYVPFAVNAPAEAQRQLIASCIKQTWVVVDAQLRRLAASAVSASRPATDTLENWDKASWFVTPNYSAIPRQDRDWSEMTKRYTSFFEQGEAPVRKEAAARFVSQIDAAYGRTTYMDPPEARVLCVRHLRPPQSEAAIAVFGLASAHDQAVLANESQSSGLSALDAKAWIEATCQLHHDELTKKRVQEALAQAGTDASFKKGEKIGVRDAAGNVQMFDPVSVVSGAAIDGFAVRFKPGWLSGSTLRITPLGQANPTLTADLDEKTRPDGVSYLEINGLTSLPGLDGPEETLRCIGVPLEKAQTDIGDELQKAVITGALGGISAMERHYQGGKRLAEFSQACQSAKIGFLGAP